MMVVMAELLREHRSLEMSLVYARIADRVVADEYASVCEQIDTLYDTAATPGALPAQIEIAAMTKLRTESHARMLGNGLCTRPVELDCRMESACETCAYFKTGPQFLPVLLRQRDHARTHGQTDRTSLYDHLVHQAGETSPDTDPAYNARSERRMLSDHDPRSRPRGGRRRTNAPRSALPNLALQGQERRLRRRHASDCGRRLRRRPRPGTQEGHPSAAAGPAGSHTRGRFGATVAGYGW
jgi:hypothetical protein